MKVYVAPPPKLSQAMHRVGAALQAHLPPGHHVVDTPEQADLEVLHVIGYKDARRDLERLDAAKRKFAVIQYCLKSTSHPNPVDWFDLWRDATCVWSYYDLRYLHGSTIYHAPLGIDPAFHRMPNPLTERRDTTLLTTGYVAPSECLQN